MRSDIVPGGIFPDYELPDHTGKLRKLSELQGEDPLILTLARDHYCPKEHQQHLELAAFYPKLAVAYTQIATIATDDHHTLQEFRASVGAEWTFLSDPDRTIQKDLDIQEYTDPEHNPMIPHRVPMLLGGDECRRTLRGNNNAYCQDNEVSWFDWSLLEKHKEIQRFTRGMINFRRTHPVLRREVFYTDADIKWFAPNGASPSWTDERQKSFACLILGQTEPDLFLMFNADTRPVDFVIPALPASKIWRLAVDTSRSSPDDLFEAGKEPSMQGQISFRVEPRSSAILLTDDGEVPSEN